MAIELRSVSTLSTAFPPRVRDGFKRMIETGHANIHELLTSNINTPKWWRNNVSS
jgi:hypothetical protein